MAEKMAQEKNQNKFVLITGGSSGLGKCFATIFAKNGYNLLLIGIDEIELIEVTQELKEKYKINARYFVTDLTLKESGKMIFDWTAEQNIHIYCLVNNVGIGNYGKFTEIPIEKQNDLIELNIRILTEMCYRFLPGMVKAKEGKILNVASLAAFQPGPYFSTYYASKAYVLYFSEALALEYKKENITISALCPSPMKTNFFKRAGMVPSWFMKLQMTNPQNVAEIGFKGLMKNKMVIIPGIQNNFVSFCSRVLPKGLVAILSKKLVELSAENKHPIIPS